MPLAEFTARRRAVRDPDERPFMRKRYRPAWLMVALLACATGSSHAAPPTSSSPSELRAVYAAMSHRLETSAFRRPVVLTSADTADGVRGDIFAVVDHPFASVAGGLNGPQRWCEVMFLHLNTKYCKATVETSGNTLTLYVGKKTPQALSDATRVEFRYRLLRATPEYLEINLDAAQGPMGVSDVHVALIAVALSRSRTFLHFDYSYSVSTAARFAMGIYLGTVGRDKVGFTATGQDAQGRPTYVRGMRGLVERNTMRYYLAIDSVLAASSTAADAHMTQAARMESRERHWFAAIEEYPRQLHELDLAAYLQMKRGEFARQQTSK